MLHSQFSLVFLLALLSNVVYALPQSAGSATVNNGSPTITLPSGTLIGTTASPTNGSPVNIFLGVPFAQSPPNRFAPPTAPKKYGVYNATFLRPACYQEFPFPKALQEFTKLTENNPYGPTPLENEDCLYLNIWTPGGTPPAGGYPVMFWIFGGAYQIGYAGDTRYDGTNFAAYQDIIIVDVAYRTNVFGFVSSPAIPPTQRNPGFLDQHFGLQWVHDNIAAFGGDPSRVTIFGWSAGAFGVDALLTSLPNSDLFHGAIMQSGQATIGGATQHDPSKSLRSWNILVKKLKCQSKNSNKKAAEMAELACVRAADPTRIKHIQQVHSLAFSSFVDNITVVPAPFAQRKAGNVSQVPVLIGSTAGEGRLFDYGQTDFAAFAKATFALLPSLIPVVNETYPADAFPDAFSRISQVSTDLDFGCTAAQLANLSYSGGIPTWRYYFNASFANLQIVPNLGVYHGSEIPLVFASHPLVTAQEEALSSYMMWAWAKFAKNPSNGPGWPQIGAFNGSLGVLGANGTSGVTVVDPQYVDFRCSIYDQVYQFTSP